MAKLFLTLTILCVVGSVLGKGFIKWSHIVEYMGNIRECKEEVGATDFDLDDIRKYEPLLTMEAKCFRSCFLKKYELMDDNGKYSKKRALSYLEKFSVFLPDELIEMATEIVEKCSEIDVSDNECEAAVQYDNCVKDEAIALIKDKFDF